MIVSIGTLIWVSVRPIIRLALTVGTGFAITKADIFPIIAATGAGQIALKIAMPCLLFSKIVPAFTSDNIHNLGPLILVACIYQGLGLVTAIIIKQFLWVPHRFRYGILMAGCWSNYADIPTAVVMSVTASTPFNGSTDETLGVAYVAGFILVFFLTLFPCGGWRLIEMDFQGGDIPDDEVREAMSLKRKAIFARTESVFRKARHNQELKSDLEKCPESPKTGEPAETLQPALIQPDTNFSPDDTTAVDPSVIASGPKDHIVDRAPSPGATSTQVGDSNERLEYRPTLSNPSGDHRVHFRSPSPSLSPSPRPSLHKRLLKQSHIFLLSLLQPASISILAAIPIAAVTPLKALFVAVDNSPIPNAPDGQPPLAFLYDTTEFIGGASVPIGLICLGSALARLKMPRGNWSSLPLAAILCLAVVKMVVVPVLGVLICNGLTNVGVIDRDDNVLRFVCMFFSCLPTATSQVYLTQVYSSTGDAGHISIFLLPQYALMVICMPIMTAYTINVLF